MEKLFQQGPGRRVQRRKTFYAKSKICRDHIEIRGATKSMMHQKTNLRSCLRLIQNSMCPRPAGLIRLTAPSPSTIPTVRVQTSSPTARPTTPATILHHRFRMTHFQSRPTAVETTPAPCERWGALRRRLELSPCCRKARFQPDADKRQDSTNNQLEYMRI